MSSFRAPLAVLAAGALVLGTSEQGVAGLLPSIGAGLRVSAGAAGLLVTAYAVAVAVGGPVLTAASRRHGHRRVLVAALLAMAAGNALTAAVPWYPGVFAARALTGAAAAVYAVAALGAAGAIAGPTRQGRAVAIIFGGVTAAGIVGVPLCTLLGGWLGWRTVYLLLAAASLAVVPPLRYALTPAPAHRSTGLDPERAHAAIDRVGRPVGGGPAGGAVHRRGPRPVDTSVRRGGGLWPTWFGRARPRQLVGIFAANAAVQAAQYAVSTYLVVMAEAAGLRGAAVAGLLLSSGVAGVVGTVLGGRLADRHPRRTAVASAAVLAGMLAVLPVVLGNAVLLWAAAVAFVVAAAAFSTAAQVCVGNEVGAAGGVAGAANISVSNVGIATGSALGGTALRLVGLPGPAVFGAAMAAAALAASLSLRTGPPAPAPAR